MSGDLPGSYESMYRSALEAAGTGQVDKAIERWGCAWSTACARLRPETLTRKPDLRDMLWRTWYATVQFLRWEKRFPEAIDLGNRVADRLEDPDEARQFVGSLMIEQGQVDQGLACLSEIAERRQVSTYWVHLAVEQIALRRFELAEASCRAGLSLAQDNDQAASANLTLFELYQRTGQVDQALSAWNMATVLNTGLGDLVSQVTDWLIHRGELGKARTYLARDTNPVTQSVLRWADRLAQQTPAARQGQVAPCHTDGAWGQWTRGSGLARGIPPPGRACRVTEWVQQAQSVPPSCPPASWPWWGSPT